MLVLNSTKWQYAGQDNTGRHVFQNRRHPDECYLTQRAKLVDPKSNQVTFYAMLKEEQRKQLQQDTKV